MKTGLIALAILSLAAAAGAASAQGPGMRMAMGRMWANADANKDGAISKAEFEAARAQRFALMDGDKDGFVTEAEMRASLPNGGRRLPQAAGAQAGGAGARLDANGDGKVSKAEFVDGGAAQFARLDADKDGRIDKAELADLVGRGGGGG